MTVLRVVVVIWLVSLNGLYNNNVSLKERAISRTSKERRGAQQAGTPMPGAAGEPDVLGRVLSILQGRNKLRSFNRREGGLQKSDIDFYLSSY